MSNEKILSAQKMRKALERLDELLHQNLKLIIGGGGAMVLAHHFELATMDIDAIPTKGFDLQELAPLIKRIAKEHNLAPDWLNPYFSTFSYTLPSNYGERLQVVLSGKMLEALALGKEDLLIMKCFAHRPKDVVHARALIKKGADVKLVERHLEMLHKKEIPGALEALDFLDELL